MQETLLYLSYLGIILLIGLLCSVLSKKIRIPNILLLIFVGIALGNIYYKGQPLIQFPQVFLTSIAILALVMIVFDSSSRFKIREFDTLSMSSLKLTIIFLILNATLLSLLTFYIYKPASWILAVLFAVVMSGTAPSAIMIALKGAKTRVFELLEIESIINTPLIVLIPFLILDIIENLKGKFLITELTTQIIPFAQQLVTGIGAGILVGLIIFKIMKKRYSPTLSPLTIITAALLTYLIAEHLGGNGVLAVTTMGLFFGNVYIQHKRKLQEFSETFATFLEILVFILIGMIIKIPLTFSFFISSAYLFIAYLFIRFLSVHISFIGPRYTFKEKLFMTLNIPKGIAVAVIVFMLAASAVTGIKPILDLILIFMIYSIVLSSIVTKFSKYFTKVEAIPKEGFK